MGVSIVREWRAFRDDEPGRRFHNHYDRMRQQGSRAGKIVRIGAGLVLIAVGVVMLFTPGPGLLGVLFGFGLLGGESRRIADALDRLEPAARERGEDFKRWWKALPRLAQIGLCLLTLGVLFAVGCQLWLWFFGSPF